MKLDPNKTLEDNYKSWLSSVKDDADFFAQAWAHAAEHDQPTPEKSKRVIGQWQPELPDSYTPSIDGTVNNLSRVIYQEARDQVIKDAMKRSWGNQND